MPDNGFGEQGQLGGLPDPRLLHPAALQDRPRRFGRRRRSATSSRSATPTTSSASRSSTRAPPSDCSPAADIDPESLQRGPQRRPVGGRRVRAVDPALRRARPAPRPAVRAAGLKSPNNPILDGAARPPSRTAAASRRWRSARTASSCTPPSRAPTVADADQTRRYIYEFSIGRAGVHRPRPGSTGPRRRATMVSDMSALDRHRLVVIERDGGSGVSGAVPQGLPRRPAADRRRRVPREDRRSWTSTAIPDPDLVSLPAIHPGDVGLGDPFRVTCESVEAVHVVARRIGSWSAATTTSRTPAATRRWPTTTSSSSSPSRGWDGDERVPGRAPAAARPPGRDVRRGVWRRGRRGRPERVGGPGAAPGSSARGRPRGNDAGGLDRGARSSGSTTRSRRPRVRRGVRRGHGRHRPGRRAVPDDGGPARRGRAGGRDHPVHPGREPGPGARRARPSRRTP